MKYRTLFFGIILSIAFAFNINAQHSDFPVLKGPYLGQKPPGMTPEVFAPGIISTESPDGKYLFYTFFKSDSNTDIFWVDAKIIEEFKSKESI